MLMYMEFEFNEGKLEKDGKSLSNAYKWLDYIAGKCKLDKYKVRDGYFESTDENDLGDLQAFMNMYGVLSGNSNINKYCEKWVYYDYEEQEENDCLIRSIRWQNKYAN